MMKFGLLTAILDGWSFEEVVEIASDMGFKCLEVACWPAGKAERRYAGVSHIDCERVCEDDAYAAYEMGVSAIFSTNRLAIPFSQAKTRSEQDYRHTLEDLLRMMQVCKAMKA